MSHEISDYYKQLNEREEANQRFALGDEGYRLYKAAPDLLAALENLIQYLEAQASQADEVSAVLDAREAIAKAKGGE